MKKRIISLLLALLILLSSLGVNTVYADTTYRTSQLGTQTALGSPLLSGDSYDIENWNKWELVVFGIFLSNFCQPLVDDYSSAFTTTAGGSGGKGKEALIFGTGNDSGTAEVLDNMLEYCIKAQQNTFSKLIVKYKNYNIHLGGNGEYKTNGSGNVVAREASVRDIFPIYVADKDALKAEYGRAEMPFFGNGKLYNKFVTEKPENLGYVTQSWTGYLIYNKKDAGSINILYPDDVVLPELYVKDNNGNEKLVFNFADGWDSQMFSAWISNIMNSEYKDLQSETFEKIYEAETPLGIDMFGNIVTRYNGKNIIILPAAANQHLTTTSKYNLLNSLLLNGSYLDCNAKNNIAQGFESNYSIEVFWEGGKIAPKNTMWADKLFAGSKDLNWYVGDITIFRDSKSIEDGTVFIYQDTDTYWYQYMKQNLTTDSSKYSFGNSLYNVLLGNMSETASSIPFKIETVGGHKDFDNTKQMSTLDWQLMSLSRMSAYISNVFPTLTNTPILNHMYMLNGKTTQLFAPYSIFTTTAASTTNTGILDEIKRGNPFKTYITTTLNDRLTTDYAGLTYDVENGGNKTSTTKISADVDETNLYLSRIRSAKSLDDLYKILVYDEENETFSNLFKYHLATSSYVDRSKKNFTEFNSIKDFGDIESKLKIKPTNGYATFKNAYPSPTMFGRIIKVYKLNSNLTTVQNIFGIKDGTNFGAMIPSIYLTYLKWYGIIDATTDGGSELDKTIFQETNDLTNTSIQSIIGNSKKTPEQKEQEAKDNAYLMLSLDDEGREYRKNMVSNWLKDLLYENYDNVIYNNSIKTSTTSARVANSFLKLNTYQENMFTSWFMQHYAKIIIWLMLIAFIILILITIISRRKIIWFFANLVILIFTLIGLPSLSEIVPFVANNAVQQMFENNSTYWAIAESINNDAIEKNFSNANDIDKSGWTEIMQFTKMFNTLHIDRALMFKNDISQKVVGSLGGLGNEIQKLASVRWLLPTLMKQYTADDKTSNYVSVTLGDLYEKMTYLYCSYHPGDLYQQNNYVRQSFIEPIEEFKIYSTEEKQKLYAGYKTIETLDETEEKVTYRSLSQHRADEELSHTSFYLLKDIEIPSLFNENYTNAKLDEFLNEYSYYAIADVGYNSNQSILQAKLQSKTNDLISSANEFILGETALTQDFGYLWLTENAMPYFYQMLKETLPSDITLPELITELQGYYGVNEITGDEVRQSFMHYNSTGYVRDILDLEELFTNVIPYMYTVDLLAGGKDGTSGLLGEEKLKNYSVYEENYSSWLYRCNWVAKIVESSKYGKTTVKDKIGQTYTVLNQAIPQCYPPERPMIFSRAQMYAEGLTESKLSNLELDLIELNDKIAEKWTLLINYANSRGMTTEIMIRQMAMTCVLEFNKALTPSNINASLSLYPTTLDLRSISYDSVMKLIILNDTRDSRYAQSDTMQLLLEDENIFTAILIFVNAILNVYIIPLCRDLTIALLFYLCFIIMVWNFIAPTKVKVKLSTAFLIGNGLYLILNLLYYAVYASMISKNTADSVLNVNNIVINSNIPTFKFLLIFIASILFIYVNYKFINFIAKNYRDLGAGTYQYFAHKIVSGINEGAAKMLDGALGGGTSDNSTHTTINVNQASNDTVQKVQVENEQINTNETNISTENTALYSNTEIDSGYTTTQIEDVTNINDVNINQEIEKGRTIANDYSTNEYTEQSVTTTTDETTNTTLE